MTNPELVKEWNFEKNKHLKIEKITFGSDKKIWWKCEKGHEWKTQVKSRTLKKCGCP